MDIVERCSNYLSTGGLFNPELADHNAVRDLVIDCRDEIERLREALQKIADLEYEDLPAPKSANETVLWVCLDRCITFAETALKEKE